MRANTRILASLTLAAVLTWCLACAFAGNVQALCGSVSVRWDAGGVSPAELLRREEYSRQDGAENQPEATLWREELSRTVSDNGERSRNADIVTVFGDASEAAPAPVLSGAFPARSDPEGCAVSSELAFSLWGSLDVLGMPVKLGDELYYVRGVFKSNESRLLIQASESSQESLSNMQLKFSDGGGREAAESFLTSANFGGGTVLDLPLLGWICEVLSLAPAVLLAAGILLRLIKRALTLRHYAALLLGYLPYAALAAAGTLLCLRSLEIPARLIPTMWSDFDFWARLFTGLWQNLTVWLRGTPGARDMQLWPALIAMLLLVTAASFLLLTAARLVRMRSYSGLAVYGSVYMLGMCTCALAVSVLGAVTLDWAVYLMPCVWLCTDFMLYLHEGHLKVNEAEGREQGDKKALESKKMHAAFQAEGKAEVPARIEERAEALTGRR